MPMRGEAFERLYSDHAEALLGFLVYRTGDRALAEDLLADTFEKVLRARRPFDRRRASEKTWLYSIALNCVTDHRRRQAAEGRAIERVAVPASEPTPSPAGGVEDRDAVDRALHGLADDEREAIALRYGADLTVPEIAGLTGDKLTTVEGRVYRALRKLRDDMS
jgi:RNA polymerase sigma factor (sigma-70 family)